VQNIEWKPELSIGIDKVDDDHKHLIELINKLMRAIENDAPKNEILKFFDELEAYTHYHFKREESFMLAHCHPKHMAKYIGHHQKQHRYFTGKLPKLKEKLIHTTSKSASFDIVEFLLRWLLDHIINEDLKLAQCFEEEKEKKIKKNLFYRISNIIKERTTLSQRLLIIFAIPMIFLILQSSFVSYNAYNRYCEFEKVQNITQTAMVINNVLTQLQRERGLSSAYISSNYHHFQKELETQRKRTSATIRNGLAYTTVLQRYINLDNEFKAIEKLAQIRTQIDAGQLTKEQSIAYYTGFIDRLIKLIKQISYLSFNTVDQNTYGPLLLLLRLNELHGLIRNEGVACLEEDNASCDHLDELFKSKNTYDKAFAFLAPEHLKTRVQDIESSPDTQHIMQIQQQIVTHRIKGNKAAQVWFAQTTVWIDRYKQIIEKTFDNINKDAVKQKQHFSTLIWTIWTIFILMLLFIGISMYLLKESIIRPIIVLTDALHKLSEGDKQFFFSAIRRKDAIGKMERAYNHLRRSLIKADYANILMNLQEMKTKKYVRLSEEDPLTGIYNRRAFTQTLKTEMAKAQKQHTPLSLLILDIDHFKKINDTYGHDTGDLLLQHFVKVIQQQIRKNDLFARIGGEEFALLLPDTAENGARIRAEKIVQTIASLDLKHIAPDLQMTVSIGFALYQKEMSLKTFIQKADKHLYKAKHSGRNRVCC